MSIDSSEFLGFDPNIHAWSVYSGIGEIQGQIERFAFIDPFHPDYDAWISHDEDEGCGVVHRRTFSYAPIVDDEGVVQGYGPQFADCTGGQVTTYLMDMNSGVWAYTNNDLVPSVGDPLCEEAMYRGMQALLLRLLTDGKHASMNGMPLGLQWPARPPAAKAGGTVI